jgi:predicted lipid-binding transport protein (Tim44 family)
MKPRTFLAVIALALATILMAQVGDTWARVSGGGSRGSRSFSAPARPSPSPSTPMSPSSPSRSFGQPSPVAPSPMPRRGNFFGGLMGGIAGFALGGLLGSLLFGGFGHGLGGFGGIGLLDLLLIGGGLMLLFAYLRRRRQASESPYATGGPSMSSYDTTQPDSSRWGGPASVEMPSGGDHGDLDRGLAHIRQMDPGFDPSVFADRVRTEFTNVQSVLAVKDPDVLRDRLTPEMYAVLKSQCEALRSAGRTDYVQKIDVERSEATEAWQESGQDFVTVYFAVSMIDYTVDDRTGQVVEGSRTEPQRVEEFWTFTRPVGPNPWKLSAIQPV